MIYDDDVRNIFSWYIEQIFTALLFGKWLKISPFVIGGSEDTRNNSKLTASSHLGSIFLTISLMSSINICILFSAQNKIGI